MLLGPRQSMAESLLCSRWTSLGLSSPLRFPSLTSLGSAVSSPTCFLRNVTSTLGSSTALEGSPDPPSPPSAPGLSVSPWSDSAPERWEFDLVWSPAPPPPLFARSTLSSTGDSSRGHRDEESLLWGGDLQEAGEKMGRLHEDLRETGCSFEGGILP